MKLPIGFGNKFFFRVVFPGGILSAGLFKLTFVLATHANVAEHLQYIVAVQIFILGWCFVVLDMPIYMLFEGRRYWPTWAMAFFQGMERRRLASLHKKMRWYDAREARGNTRFQRAAAGRQSLEMAVEISDFPLSEARSMPEAVWPTRLGNLIAAYEQYPRLKYGLDAVFFWPRIWVSIDQPLREEIDNQQAQADGLLYSVVALSLSGAAFALYRLFHLDWPAATSPNLVKLDEFLVSAVCIALALAVYRFSLHMHRQFGELFKATFDQHKSKIVLDETVRLVSHISDDMALLNAIDYKKNIAAWRFLRWHRARIPGESKNRRVRMP